MHRPALSCETVRGRGRRYADATLENTPFCGVEDQWTEASIRYRLQFTPPIAPAVIDMRLTIDHSIYMLSLYIFNVRNEA